MPQGAKARANGPSAVGSAASLVATLAFCQFLTIFDRNLLPVLALPIRASLALTDTEIGLMQGTGLALLYALAIVPAGLLADRLDRCRLLTTGHSRWILVASPKTASGLGADIADLARLPTLGTSDEAGEVTWMLEREDCAAHVLRYEPRMTCADYAVLCDAAADGLGVAFLPDHACAAH